MTELAKLCENIDDVIQNTEDRRISHDNYSIC